MNDMATTAQFLWMCDKYNRTIENKPYRETVETYRGRRLRSILTPCGVMAALEQGGTRVDRKQVRTSSNGVSKLLDAIDTMKEPYDEADVEQIARQIGFIQPETLVDVVHSVRNIAEEMSSRLKSPVTMSYREPLIIKNDDGEVYIRTMNDIVLECADERVVFNVRHGLDTIDTIEDIYYVSMLGNMWQHPGKKITIGSILAIHGSGDMVMPSFWKSAHDPDVHSDSWYEKKVRDFIFFKHQSFPKDVSVDLTQVKITPDTAGICRQCPYVSFCKRYIQKKP